MASTPAAVVRLHEEPLQGNLARVAWQTIRSTHSQTDELGDTRGVMLRKSSQQSPVPVPPPHAASHLQVEQVVGLCIAVGCCSSVQSPKRRRALALCTLQLGTRAAASSPAASAAASSPAAAACVSVLLALQALLGDSVDGVGRSRDASVAVASRFVRCAGVTQFGRRRGIPAS